MAAGGGGAPAPVRRDSEERIDHTFKGSDEKDYSIRDVALHIIGEGDDASLENTERTIAMLSAEDFKTVCQAFQVGVLITSSTSIDEEEDEYAYSEDEYEYDDEEVDDISTEVVLAKADPRLSELFKSLLTELTPKELSKALPSLIILQRSHFDYGAAYHFSKEQALALGSEEFIQILKDSEEKSFTLSREILHELFMLSVEERAAIRPHMKEAVKSLDLKAVQPFAQILVAIAPEGVVSPHDVFALVQEVGGCLTSLIDGKELLTAKILELGADLPEVVAAFRETEHAVSDAILPRSEVVASLLKIVLHFDKDETVEILGEITRLPDIHKKYTLNKSPTSLRDALNFFNTSAKAGFYLEENKDDLYSLIDILPKELHHSIDTLASPEESPNETLRAIVHQDLHEITHLIHAHAERIFNDPFAHKDEMVRLGRLLYHNMETLTLDGNEDLLQLALENASKGTIAPPADAEDLGIDAQLFYHGKAMRAKDNPFPFAHSKPTERLLGKSYILNMEKLKEVPQSFKKSDLPGVDRYTVDGLLGPDGLIRQVYNSLADGSNEKNILRRFIFAGDGYNRDVLRFLTLPEDPDAEVSEVSAFFFKTIDFIMSLDDEEVNEDLGFTHRRAAIIELCDQVQGCASGRLRGVQTAYAALPAEAKYPRQSGAHGEKKPLIDAVLGRISEKKEAIISSREFVNSLKMDGDEEIGDWAHPMQYVRNLLGLPLGMQKRLAFDINVGSTPLGIRYRTYDFVFDRFVERFPLRTLAEAVMETAYENKDLLYSLLKESSEVKEETLEGGEYDEETFERSDVTVRLQSELGTLLRMTSKENPEGGDDITTDVELTLEGAYEVLRLLDFVTMRKG